MLVTSLLVNGYCFCYVTYFMFMLIPHVEEVGRFGGSFSIQRVGDRLCSGATRGSLMGLLLSIDVTRPLWGTFFAMFRHLVFMYSAVFTRIGSLF